MHLPHRQPNAKYILQFLTFSFAVGGAALLFFLGAIGVSRTLPAQPVQSAQSPADRPVIVIDPGHGGEDGGASAPDGTKEKDLNLSVSLCTAEIPRAAGYDVRLSRSDDRLLYDMYGDFTDYTGRKKTYDLRNRLRFAREAEAGLLVSIHMNMFPDPRYSGLQVYYSPASPESRTVADTVQSYARLYLQPQNTRETKAATSAIYLLHRAEIPSVMIECGFLSNEEELRRLQSESYRMQLALTIACAIGESLSGPQ